MILKGNQRGGGKQLAAHLLKVEDNEHVHIHELRGFMSDNLHSALHEAYAVSRGTRAKQFLFSLSLNPPPNENVSVDAFEAAIKTIEQKLGLDGQPRAIVFHEKEGRRHAHVVWSRIDTEAMKAINLPFYKTKLRDVSRELFYEHGWKMPQGLLDGNNRDPLNYSLREWQQAKRQGEDPKALQRMFQNCWAASDNRPSFEQALQRYGLYLAKGDQRGYVAIDYRGEVYSLSRWLKVKTKALKERLGPAENLPGTQEVKARIAERMTDRLKTYIHEAQARLKQQLQPFIQKKRSLQHQHQNERSQLEHQQGKRWQQESLERSQRLPKGFKGIWFRITGKYHKIREQNERETERCRMRDREETQQLIDRQLATRRKLQEQIQPVLEGHKQSVQGLRQDIARYMEMGETPAKAPQEAPTSHQKHRGIDYTPEL
ncbi:MAG TPA: relaxase/mobilization nuclease domain-containing protein [Nitrospira sp.]|nr:relaxase/mobilization nuclease domain-containing protein [Nitrospira sp.]